MRSSQTRTLLRDSPRFYRGRGQRFEARRKRFDEKIDKLLCAAAIGILIGIILRDIEAQQILMLHKLDEGSAHVVKAQSAAAGTFTAGKSSCAMTSTSRWRTNSRASACTCASASCAALLAPLD